MVKKYVFDFVTKRIPISNITLRRRLGSQAYCSVTLPNPVDFADLISANPTGSMVVSQVIDGTETVVGTYTLDQVLTSDSPSAFTIVLNGVADYGTDLASSISPFTLDKAITITDDSTGLKRFSSEEEALLVVGDTIILSGVSTEVQELSLFVGIKNSRMDVGVQ